MTGQERIPRTMVDRIQVLISRHGYRKVFLALGAVVVGAGLLAVEVLIPAIRRMTLTPIPEFPDCAGQPGVVVAYLREMNLQALHSPESDQAVGKLGMAYQAHLFYDQAQRCYDRAIELNGEEWKWLYYEAVVHEELGDTRAAIPDLEEVVRRNPAVSQAWFRLGNACIKTRSYADADSAFRHVLALKDFLPDKTSRNLSDHGAFPLKAYAMLQLARVKSLGNQLAEAKTVLEDLIRTNPTFGPAYRLLGSVYQQLGDGEKGTEYEIRAGDFESYLPPPDPMYGALVLCSRNTDFIIRQIDIAEEREDYTWTMTLIDHILEYSPNDGDALTRRLKLALDTQERDAIGPLVAAFGGFYAGDEMRLMDMAKYLRYRGAYEESVALLKRVITLNPKAMDAHIEFVKMLKSFKQYPLGIRYCQEVIAAEPKDAGIRIELADLLIQQGNVAAARAQLETAQKLHPDEATHCLMLARISRTTGDVPRAIADYRKSLAANPHNAPLQLELGNYLLERRMWGEASRHFELSLAASPNDIDLIERYAWTRATCPEESIRDGARALKLAQRLALVRKRTIEQDIRCGTVLAVAYAATDQFDSAVEVAEKYLAKATAMRQNEQARKLSQILTGLRSRRPFRL